MSNSALDPPSPLRIPVTLVVGLITPLLAIVAWIPLSGSERRAYLRSPLVRTGAAIAIAGALPLLAIIVAAWVGLWPDPNPNPIRPGLLFLAGSVAGCLCALIGVLRVALGARAT